MTLGTWLGRYGLIVAVLFCLYPDVDVLLASVRSVAMLLGGLIVPTPGGAGGLEGLYAILIGPLIPSALVVPSLLIWRLLGYYIFVAAGLFLVSDGVLRKRNQT